MRLGLAAILAGCGFHGPSFGDDIGPGEMAAQVVDDDAADFSGTLDDAAVEPSGLLEPAAYIRNGLHAVAYATKLFDNTVTTWADLAPRLAAAKSVGAGYAQLPDDWGNQRPTGIGLAANDGFTVVYDGEIQLAAGSHVVTVLGDDTGFAEIDPGGGFASSTSGPIVAPAAGWYPIRGAMADASSTARLLIQVDGTKVTGAVLRARVNAARGLLVATYSSFYTTTAAATNSVATSIDHDFKTVAPPFDAPGITQDSYFLRYTGQLRIDTEADYTIAPSAPGSGFDFVRVSLDRHLTTPTVHLARGWHGILVDFASGQFMNPHDTQLALAIGGAPIAPDAIRPVATSGGYIFLTTPSTPLLDAPAGGSAETSLLIPGAITPAGVVIDTMDAGWFMNRDGVASDYTSSVVIGALDLPLPMASQFGAFLTGDEHLRDQPLPATQTWSVQVTDHVMGPAGKMPSGTASAFVTTHGGPTMPFAPVWTYVSQKHPTEHALRLGKIRVDAALDGAVASLQIRTADDVAWVDVAPGDTPVIDAGDFVQYRISVTGDGWQYPTVDKVVIDYVVPSS